MPKRTLNPEIVEAAIRGFEAQKQQIDGKIVELRSLLSGRGGKAAPQAKKGTARRTISAEGRARIAAAQRKRWAAQRKKGK